MNGNSSAGKSSESVGRWLEAHMEEPRECASGSGNCILSDK